MTIPKPKISWITEEFKRQGISLFDWQNEYLCDPNSVISRMTPEDVVGLPPKLEGFEKVLGRKFTCYDCPYLKNYSPYSHCCKYFSFGRFNLHGLKPCKHFKLSKDILEIIKLRDTEIENTKIDTHPRFSLGIISYIPKHHSFSNEEEWVFCSRENIALYRLFTTRPKDIPLEIIL